MHKPPRHISPGFGERVAYARREIGYTREDVQTLTNGLISVRSLFDWEHENRYPRLGQRLRALADVLNVPLVWLLRGDARGWSRADDRGDDPWDRAAG